jgi:hypothetical protein
MYSYNATHSPNHITFKFLMIRGTVPMIFRAATDVDNTHRQISSKLMACALRRTDKAEHCPMRDDNPLLPSKKHRITFSRGNSTIAVRVSSR